MTMPGPSQSDTVAPRPELSELDKQWDQCLRQAAQQDYRVACTTHPSRLRDPSTYILSPRPRPVYNLFTY